MKQCLLLLLALLTLAAWGGCASQAAFTFLNDQVTAGTPATAATVKIYAGSDIGRPYIELGGVAATFANELDGKKYAEKIKAEAAKIGADAVVRFRQVGNMASGIAVKFR